MKVTLKWPPGYLSGANIAVTYAGTPQTFVPNAVPLTPQNDGVLITVDSAGAPNASYVITLTGMTMPAGPRAAGCNSSIWVSTSTDLRSTNFLATQKIGGQVRNVSMMIDAADRIPSAAGKTATVIFATETLISKNQQVTVSYPSGYFAPCNPFLTGFNATVGPIAQSSASIILTTTQNVPRPLYLDNIWLDIRRKRKCCA